MIPSEFLNLVRVLFPNLGVAELESAVVSISTKLEITQNATMDDLKNLQTEINSLSQLVTVTGELLREVVVMGLIKRVVLMLK